MLRQKCEDAGGFICLSAPFECGRDNHAMENWELSSLSVKIIAALLYNK